MAEKESFARILLPSDDNSCAKIASDALGRKIQKSFWASSNFSSDIVATFPNEPKRPKLAKFYIVADIKPSGVEDVRYALGSSENAVFLLHGDVVFSRNSDRFSYMAMFHPAEPYGHELTKDVSEIMSKKDRVDGLSVSSIEVISKYKPKFHFSERCNSLCVDIGGESSYAENQRYCKKIFDKDVVRRGVRYEPNFSLSILDRVEIDSVKNILPRQRSV